MIEVSALEYHYPGTNAPAVSNVSFEVEGGSIFGFLGPSGAGKSTVQKLITGLLPLDRGRVRYDGQDLRALGRSFFERVGVSFEHPNLFPKLTARENLRAFAGLYSGRGRDIDRLLDRVGLGADKDKRAGDYSKGMKQRLVFARALVHEPSFLFLDEPTSGLDPGTVQSILELIREERDRGARVLLTTHDMSVVDALCDRVAFIDRGKVVAQGAPRELNLAHGKRAVEVERREGGRIEKDIFFLDTAADRARLASAVADPAVETVHSKEATLSEIFIRLTGRGLQ